MGFVDGDKVCLRQVNREDLPIFQQYRNNYEDSKNYRTVKPLTEFDQEKYFTNIINSPQHIVFTIIEKSSLQVIGEIRASNITQYNSAELGLWVIPKCRHKGHASEALQLFLQFIFGRANINRIEARVTVHNTDSIEFFKRNNFVKEGILRQSTYYDYEYQDVVVFSMIKEEFVVKRRSSLE